MREAPRPTLRYSLSALPPVAKLCVLGAEEMLETHPAFSNLIPWSLILTASISYLVGQLIADWRNDKSWLRSEIRYRLRLFDVVHTLAVREEPGGVLRLTQRIRFARAVHNAKVVLDIAGTLSTSIVVM